jgi:hypothetical protein
VHGPSGLLALDEPGAGQHVEVLHHRRQRHREGRRNLGDGQLRLPRKAVEDGAPRRVGERSKGQIELGSAIVNHVVKYCHPSVALSRAQSDDLALRS